MKSKKIFQSISEKEYGGLISTESFFQIISILISQNETLKADFFEHFDFIDDLRSDLDQWEKENLKKIILQGIEEKEFAVSEDIDVLLDVFIMVLKGLEIPFFLQNKYEKYSPHFEGLMGILTKGLAP